MDEPNIAVISALIGVVVGWLILAVPLIISIIVKDR